MSRRPAKPWRVHGPRGMSQDFGSERAAYEAVGTISRAGNVAKVYHWEAATSVGFDQGAGSWRYYERIEPCQTPDHQRESITPMGDGFLLGDCSCGATYSVPSGGNEMAALDEAARLHIADQAVPEEITEGE